MQHYEEGGVPVTNERLPVTSGKARIPVYLPSGRDGINSTIIGEATLVDGGDVILIQVKDVLGQRLVSGLMGKAAVSLSFSYSEDLPEFDRTYTPQVPVQRVKSLVTNITHTSIQYTGQNYRAVGQFLGRHLGPDPVYNDRRILQLNFDGGYQEVKPDDFLVRSFGSILVLSPSEFEDQFVVVAAGRS